MIKKNTLITSTIPLLYNTKLPSIVKISKQGCVHS